MILLYYEVPEATRESSHIFRVVSYILSISQLAIEKPGPDGAGKHMRAGVQTVFR